MSKRRDELINLIQKAEYIEKAPTEGLSTEEVELRKKQGFVNKTQKKVTKSIWQILADNVFTFFNFIYIVIAILMANAKLPYSNFLFLIPVASNIVIGIISDVRARLAVDKLKLITDQKIRCVRNGEEIDIEIEQIVLHDIVIYKTGDQIATDGVLIEGSASIDESLVTGEAEKINKVPGDKVLSGTVVVSGKFYVRVTSVGIANYAEGLQDEAKKFNRPKSEIKRSTLNIFYVTGTVAVVMGLTMTLIWAAKLNWNITFEDFQEFTKNLSGSLVAMIPAGLYLLTSLTLTVGVLNLANKHMNVQELYCIEMLARVDTICFDKTGTLTDGNLGVESLYNYSSNYTDEQLGSYLASIVKATGDDNSTAKAIRAAFKPFEDLEATEKIPFDSAKKYSAATFGEAGTFAFGAYGFIDSLDKDFVANKIHELMDLGYRVLAIYWSQKPIKNEKLPAKLELIGVLGISDTIKPDAKDNIEWFKNNGVDIKIISGDDPITVKEIAKRVGVENADKFINMQTVEDADIPNIVSQYSVFGRVTPEQKSLLVKAMQAQGHKVAMTGDGVNDILALKSADCSIAMASGSSAAKSSAHMISVDNDFSKLPDVVAEGRRVINNLQRTASLFLCKNMFAIIISAIFLVSMLVGGPSYPFETRNMLIWEIVSIGIGGFFLALQPASKRLKGGFMEGVMSHTIPAGIAEVLCVATVYLAALFAPEFVSLEEAQVMSVIAFTAISLLSFFVICCPLDLYRGALFAVSVVISILIFYADVFWPPLASGGKATSLMGLDLKCLDAAHWAILWIMIAFVGVIYILLDIVSQNIRNNKRKKELGKEEA